MEATAIPVAAITETAVDAAALEGIKAEILAEVQVADIGIDGGSASSVFLPSRKIDGGGASG